MVAAAIVDDLLAPRQLLAARRTVPAELAGQWEFPGGKVEPGEEPEVALHRELAEELALTVTIDAEIGGPAGGWPLDAMTADGEPLRMRVWLAEIKQGKPAPRDDHDQVRWLAPGSWHDVPWISADRPIVDAVLDEAQRRQRALRC